MLAGGLSLAASPSRGQSLSDLSSLPSVGTVVSPGDLRDHLSGTTQAPGAPGPGRAYTITTSIDAQELATDNSYTVGGRAQGDFITTIRPGISVAAETSRFQGNFTYAPAANIYARQSNQSYIAQNLSGTGLATLAPDLLFLEVDAFAAVQSVQGGYGPSSTTSLSRQNQTQTTSFSASPYLTHKFGGFGTLDAGVNITYSGNNAVTGVTSNTTAPQTVQLGLLTPNTATNLGNSNYVSTTERASFATGEDFGRLSHRIAVSATQYTGDGVYRGAYRSLETYDVGYAISRFITALGEIGHESIFYNGLPPFRIDDAVWSAGAKLVPNGNSAITASYGHHEGRDDLSFDGHYSATARLQLFARYTDSLTTNSEDVANSLSSLDTTTPGALFDRSSGAPVIVGDNFFGVQNGVYRLRRLSATASLVYDRDVFSLTATRETQQVVSASTTLTTQSGPTKGAYGSLAWTHDLSPDLQSNAYVQYGTYSTGPTLLAPASSGNISFATSVSLSYALSPTLKTTAQYSFSKNGSNTLGQSSTQNAILVGLHKQF